MRLIDADALNDAMYRMSFETDDGRQQWDSGLWIRYKVFEEARDEAPTIDAVPVETVCEMFGNEAPCNFGLFGVSVDDFMCSECGEWCESNCDNVPVVECWKKFFKIWEERKNDDKSCDTCKHYDKGWDDIICDGCTKAYSNWERRDDEDR